MIKYVLALLIIIWLTIGCTTPPKPIYVIQKNIVEDSAMVVTAHPLASEIGVSIMRKGGNAVDASIAIQFALAVCYPVAGNIGGGGFMLMRDTNGIILALDFREKAPKTAYPEMYLDGTDEVIPNLSTRGALAVGVPGTVAGMWEAYSKYSALKDWKTLVQPAIDLAVKGYKITKAEAQRLNKYKDSFVEVNGWDMAMVKTGKWLAGDLLIQQELGSTLSLIAQNGSQGYYQGKVAEQLINTMKLKGGIISYEDLIEYTPEWRNPIKTTYRGYDVYSMPPPSSGGIALSQLLTSIEPYNLTNKHPFDLDVMHLKVEAERRTYADRAKHLGDSDFYEVPLTQLIDSNYIAGRMHDFSPIHASVSDSIEAGHFESDQTTHFSVMDHNGMSVSLTTTLNTSFGSKLYVKDGGYFLNNEMDDFSAKPGVPNSYGLLGAEANKIEPGKRMLSSMTPTIVTKDGNTFLIVGTPGGSTIITTVFQIITNIIDSKLNAAEAVAIPRYHHQWLPDKIQYEESWKNEAILQQLEDLGHSIKKRSSIGKVELILIDSLGQLHGAADPRGDDAALGY